MFIKSSKTKTLFENSNRIFLSLVVAGVLGFIFWLIFSFCVKEFYNSYYF